MNKGKTIMISRRFVKLVLSNDLYSNTHEDSSVAKHVMQMFKHSEYKSSSSNDLHIIPRITLKKILKASKEELATLYDENVRVFCGQIVKTDPKTLDIFTLRMMTLFGTRIYSKTFIDSSLNRMKDIEKRKVLGEQNTLLVKSHDRNDNIPTFLKLINDTKEDKNTQANDPYYLNTTIIFSREFRLFKKYMKQRCFIKLKALYLETGTDIREIMDNMEIMGKYDFVVIKDYHFQELITKNKENRKYGFKRAIVYRSDPINVSYRCRRLDLPKYDFLWAFSRAGDTCKTRYYSVNNEGKIRQMNISKLYETDDKILYCAGIKC